VGTPLPLLKFPWNAWERRSPLLSYGENANILLKMHFAFQKDVFLTLKYGKMRWRPGLRPGPRWVSLRLGIAIPDLNFQSRDSGLSNSQSRDPVGIGVV